MAMAKAIPDEPISEHATEPTFLKAVAQMATLAEEAMRKLRTEPHGDGFKFIDLDLSYLFPQTIHSVEYLEKTFLARLEPVVNDYLSQTAPYGLSQRDARAGTPIEENTARYEFTVTEWMKQVYTPRKDEIDARVDSAFLRITNHATRELRDLTFDICLGSQEIDRAFAVAGKSELSLEELAGKKAELKTRFYESELPHPEELAKLYELCFNAEVKQKGWEELDNDKLVEALKAENVPLEMFAKYTGREIKLPEEKNAKKKGKIRPIIDIITDKKSPDGAETQLIAGVPKQYHFISTSNYFAALTQLRRDCASDSNSLQPTINIAGRNYVRPSTVKELMQFRLENYNTLTNPDDSSRTEEERKQLLNQWFFTCGGIAYSTDGRFKLSREAPQLITMNSIPTQIYLSVIYSDFNGEQFNRNQRGIKYNIPLTEEEAVAHPVWRYLAEDDSTLLRETHQLNCSLYNRSDVMGSWLLNNPTQNQLRALALSYFYGYSSLIGYDDLSGVSSFLRVARRSS